MIKTLKINSIPISPITKQIIPYQLLDIVKDKDGDLGIVNDIKDDDATITWKKSKPNQKCAWYSPGEVEIIGNLESILYTNKDGVDIFTPGIECQGYLL